MRMVGQRGPARLAKGGAKPDPRRLHRGCRAVSVTASNVKDRMDISNETELKGPLSDRPPFVQWGLLLVFSGLLVGGLEYLALPAALFIGPMLMAIAAGSLGARVRVPPSAFAVSQAFVGMLIASSIDPTFLSSFLEDWPLYLAAVTATITASS